ncbi:CinA family protein [Lachnospiraceae bacterium]|nr:CinA family protein [Lachnospiraceae bacterium]
MEKEIASLLLKHHITITTAESCTGGLIAASLVNVPGISGQFGEGYIAYSNEAKEKLLGVSHETLMEYGAVSLQTAQEMASGARAAANADIAIISTGIAGPDGGTKEKPVGLVYLACACGSEIKVERHIFDGDRQQVRHKAVGAALKLVEQVIQQEYK